MGLAYQHLGMQDFPSGQQRNLKKAFCDHSSALSTYFEQARSGMQEGSILDSSAHTISPNKSIHSMDNSAHTISPNTSIHFTDLGTLAGVNPSPNDVYQRRISRYRQLGSCQDEGSLSSIIPASKCCHHTKPSKCKVLTIRSLLAILAIAARKPSDSAISTATAPHTPTVFQFKYSYTPLNPLTASTSINSTGPGRN